MAPEPELGMEDPMGETSTEEVTDDTIPLASTNDLAEQEGAGLENTPEESEKVEFDIDLGILEEAIQALDKELSEDAEIEDIDEDIEINLQTLDEVDDEELELNVKNPSYMQEENEELEEESDQDALVDAIMEKLTVDMGADLAGWAGRSSGDMKRQIEKEMAHRRSTEVEEEMDALKKAQEELVFENKQLTKKLQNYTNVVENLKENLQSVNLSNARLLYTNRVLRNTSLNERQKQKIVEAISGAETVTEAKTIFETLQSTVQATPNKSRPESLSEAIGSKRTSVIRATRKESTPSDPLSERMKRLAGIK
jgi:chromosome segregation ATPase